MRNEFGNLPLENVQFDPGNPRVALLLENHDDPSDVVVQRALGAGEQGFIKLKQAIKESSGIRIPIIVNHSEGKYTAIEGNTRLAIYQQFRREYPNEECWATIPAIIHENMDSRVISSIRLNAHLVGVRSWTPYAKAAYLHHLSVIEKLPMSELVAECGGNGNEVLRHIAAFEQVQNIYRPMLDADEEFDPHVFSQFLEVQMPRPDRAMKDEGFGKEHFAQWVKDDKFDPQNLVRKLPEILSNQRARDVFLRKNAKEAMTFVEKPGLSDALRDASLIELCDACVDKAVNLTRAETRYLGEDSGATASIHYAQLELARVLADIKLTSEQ